MIQLSPSCAVVMKALPPSQETGISHKLVMERCEVLGQKEGTSSAALSKLSKMGYAVKHQDLWTRSALGESMMKNLKDIPLKEIEKALELSPESLAAVNGDCDPEDIGPILDRMNENYRKICEGEPVKDESKCQIGRPESACIPEVIMDHIKIARPESARIPECIEDIKISPQARAPWEADLRHAIEKIKAPEIPPDAINAYGLMVEAMPESVKRVLQPITDWVLRQDKV